MKRWTFLIPGLMLAAALSSSTAMLLIKAYVDLLCIGYSFSKTALLLLFLTILWLARPYRSPWREAWNRWFFIGLAALQSLVLVEHSLFVRAVKQPWWSSLFVVDDGRFTTTKPMHLHEAKAALAWLTGYQGAQLDGGGGFLPYLPTPLLALHAGLILAVALIGFFMTHQYLRSESGWRGLCLALSVFAAAKGSLDGGPLSVESLLPLPFAWGLIYGRWRTLPLALFSLTLLGGAVAFGGDLRFQFLKLGGALAFLAAPLLWDRYLQTRTRRIQVSALLLTLALLATPFLQYWWSPQAKKPPFPLGTLVYLNRPLSAGRTVFLHHRQPLPNDGDPPFRVVKTFRGFRVDTSEVVLTRPTTPGELSRGLGLNLQHFPVTWSTSLVRYRFVGSVAPSDVKRWVKSDRVVETRVEEVDGQTSIELTLKASPTLEVAFDSLPPGNFVLTQMGISGVSPNSHINREESLSR